MNRYADIVKNVLAVDKELSADKIHKTLSVEGNIFIVKFSCSKLHLKIMRSAINGFFENLLLTTQVIKEFGENP